MRVKNQKKKWNRRLLAVVVLITCFVCSAVTAYAYFSTRVKVYTNDGSGKHVHLGMSLDLLFDSLSKDLIGEKLPTGVVYDTSQPWGSKSNPYIISDIRHLENLAVLQEVGYFYELYISKNYEVDGSYNDKELMPYFLICTPAGTPVTIDGSYKTIPPIGTDQYPFVGFVGGAFKDGTTTVADKSSDVSVIYNILVNSKTDIIDVGLFGTIGYLGVENPESDIFVGKVSTVKDLLLCDVQVIAKPTIAGTVEELVHRFAYSALSTGDKAKVPKEDHHIGILAGHVEYANVNYISVYYSADDVPAIEISNAGKNYSSSTGIIGFMYAMNPKVDVKDDKDNITKNSGTGSDSIGVNNGIGTGGGKESGTGRGYVVAAEIYDIYKKGGKDDLVLLDAKDEDNSLCTEYVRKRILWGTENTGLYYFYDGVFTFALSSKVTNSNPTINDKITSTWDDEENIDQYVTASNTDNIWKRNTTQGNNSVIAFVKDIKTKAELDAAIKNGKQIYIGYEFDSGKKISLMSLAADQSKSSVSWKDLGDDAFTTNAFSKDMILLDEDINSIHETLAYASEHRDTHGALLPCDNSGNIMEDVITNTNNYRLINLGTGDDLEVIKKQYPIDAVGEKGTYTFSTKISSENKNMQCYLNLLVLKGIASNRIYGRSIFTSTSDPSGSLFTSESKKTATIEFQEDKEKEHYGTAKISFTLSTKNGWVDDIKVTRYVQIDVNNQQEYRFKGSDTDTADECNLHFYTVEGTSNLNFGRITFDPKDKTTQKSYEADKVLLWPMETYPNANGDTSRTAAHASYSLKVLEDVVKDFPDNSFSDSMILKSSVGWKNKKGDALSIDDLHKKFAMEKSASWGATFTVLRGNYSIGDGTVVAPVGTLGVEANIPLGTIAFRVNKNAPEGKTFGIKVIVAAPQCDYYDGEAEAGDFYSRGTYYVGLWQMEANGQYLYSSFNADNCLKKFELPKSNPYKPSNTASSSDYILVDTDGNNAVDQRCYLNGNKVLVAYEFEVTKEGVYVLAAINGPLEIVYFSADATASGGRDGTLGSTLGSIDFVYDHTDEKGVDNIVTVKDTSGDGLDEDFDYYYASLCLLYINSAKLDKDNKYIDVNDAKIFVNRYIDGSPEKSHMNINSSGSQASSIELTPYGADSDTVHDARVP